MNKLSRAMTILICATSAAILVPLSVFMLVNFPFKQTPDERSLSTFTSTPIVFTPKTWQPRSINCPVTATDQSLSKQAGTASLTEGVQKTSEAEPLRLPLLTFILYEGNSKKDTAILDGQLLKKGNSLHGWQVIRIEPKRVQLSGRRGKQWVSIENQD